MLNEPREHITDEALFNLPSDPQIINAPKWCTTSAVAADAYRIPAEDFQTRYRLAEGAHEGEEGEECPHFLGLTTFGWVLLACCAFWIFVGWFVRG